MSQYPGAEFLTSANAPGQFWADAGCEVAVAGRSNAGKSSAINAIVNRRQFARTSKTPGRTQLINFFALAENQRLVDLPGYGFARVSAATQRHWGRLLQQYFEQRRSLTGLFLVVDIRRLLGEFDHRMLALAASVAIPVHVLLTKADKLSRNKAAAAKKQVAAELADAAQVTVQTFSAPSKACVYEARAVLAEFLARPSGGH